MTKKLSRINIEVHNLCLTCVTVGGYTDSAVSSARKKAADVAAVARKEGFEVAVTEFYADGTRFIFKIA